MSHQFAYICRMDKSEQISVRVSVELKTAMTAVAKEERRSLSAQIEKVLADWLKSIDRGSAP